MNIGHRTLSYANRQTEELMVSSRSFVKIRKGQTFGGHGIALGLDLRPGLLVGSAQRTNSRTTYGWTFHPIVI